MTPKQQREEDLLTIVKKNPGLATRGIWLKSGLSETRQPVIRERLLSLQLQGKVRCEDLKRGDHVWAHCWWAVTP